MLSREIARRPPFCYTSPVRHLYLCKPDSAGERRPKEIEDDLRSPHLHPQARQRATFEENFAKALPHRLQYSPLAAFWHTEIGPLNQVIHVWPYESLDERTRIRAEAAQDPNWPPANDPDMYVNMESEIFIPAPFMRPLGDDQALGNIYEMRSYTYKTGSMGEVLKRWEAAVPTARSSRRWLPPGTPNWAG